MKNDEGRAMNRVGRSAWHRSTTATLALAVMLTALPACRATRDQKHEPAELPRLVWPEPPDPARIELVNVFGRPSAFGIEPTVWQRVIGFIAGGGEAQMVRPAGIAADGERVAIADAGAGRVDLYDRARHRSLSRNACDKTVLGVPVAVAFLGERLYVSDAGAARIHVFDPDGGCQGSWELEPGSRPAGLAADAGRSRLYVADAGAHQVLAFDTKGDTVLRFGKRGSGVGEFNYPTWLALDASGRLYVTDSLNFRVQIFDADGRPLGSFGHHGDGSGDLARPKGIGVDRDGHLYLVDALFDGVQIFDREGQYLMVFGSKGIGPGQFWLPSGLAIDGDRIYVADSYNQRVQVFRLLGGE